MLLVLPPSHAKCQKGYTYKYSYRFGVGYACQKNNECTCANGTPTVATGSAGTLCDIADEDCSACDAGYALSAPAAAAGLQTCKRQCAAFFFDSFVTGVVVGTTSPCSNGQVLPQSGTCNVDCAAGYGTQTDVAIICASNAELGDPARGAPTCVPNTCSCPNGTPTVATGTTAETLCDVAGVDCSACDVGYTIDVSIPYSDRIIHSSDAAATVGKQVCVENTCSCPFGTPTVATGTTAGTLCDVAGVDCSVCDTMYYLSATAATGSQTCVACATIAGATASTCVGANAADIQSLTCSASYTKTGSAGVDLTCVPKTSDNADKVKNVEEAHKAGEASEAGEGTDAATKEEDSRVKIPIHVWFILVSLGIGCVLTIYGAFRLVEGCVYTKRPSVTRKESDGNNIEMTTNPMKMNNGIESPLPVWTSHQTEDNKVYFSNGARSTWTDHAKNMGLESIPEMTTNPMKMNKGIKSSPVPVWTSHRTEDNKVYFNNGARSTWTNHAAMRGSCLRRLSSGRKMN